MMSSIKLLTSFAKELLYLSNQILSIMQFLDPDICEILLSDLFQIITV